MILWSFETSLIFPKILRLKSFSNSWDNSYIPCLLLIILFRFTCGENKTFVKYQKVSKYHANCCLKNFIVLFMSLLKTPFVKNSCILAGIYFIIKKNTLDQIWKSFNTEFGPQNIMSMVVVSSCAANQYCKITNICAKISNRRARPMD